MYKTFIVCAIYFQSEVFLVIQLLFLRYHDNNTNNNATTNSNANSNTNDNNNNNKNNNNNNNNNDINNKIVRADLHLSRWFYKNNLVHCEFF